MQPPAIKLKALVLYSIQVLNLACLYPKRYWFITITFAQARNFTVNKDEWLCFR
jgi:hypothetical protein